MILIEERKGRARARRHRARANGKRPRVNAERGTTVLLTTHDLSDIERLCRRVMIIDHGRLLYDGGLEAVRARLGGERTLVVDLEEPAAPLVVAGATVVRTDGPRQWLRFHRGEISAAELVGRVMATSRVVDLAIEEPDIEEVVRRLYLEGQT